MSLLARTARAVSFDGESVSARLSRRDWLAATAWGGAVAISARCFAAEENFVVDDRSPVVDTHLHCFAGAGDERFPYHQSAPYRPEAAATPQHLIRCMDGAGVDYAVAVHPEPYQDDHRFLDHCLQVGGGRLKGTCLFFADRPESLAQMQPYLRQREGQVIAARLHAYAPDRLPPFGTPELDRLWQIASDCGVAMQLHFEPRYASQLDPYVRKYSSTRVIIDHLGRPMQGTPQEHSVVMRWSELPNTVMKLSSIPRRDRYPHRDVRPILKAISEAWGSERLIYGGGFNAEANGESYRGYREELRRLMPHLSAAEWAAIAGGNAARLFGFGSE